MEISQKIIDYTIWYYLKYFPSKKKLERKLLEKFWPNSENWKKYWGIWEKEINYIFDEKMSSIIDEEQVIISKIRSYKSRWKSKLYIKQKLFERQEPKELIDKYLEEFFLEWEEEAILKEYEKIKHKIKNYKNEHEYKSKLIQKLMMKWFSYDEIKSSIF